MAEPISAWIATAIVKATTLTAATAATIASWITYTAIVVGNVAIGQSQARKARRSARNAYNASLEDRMVTIRSAVAPRAVVYGRARVGGTVVYMESTGDKKQFLHLVVVLAGHQIDAVEQIWFNDELLPTPDANGFINSGKFAKVERADNVHVWSAASTTLPTVPGAIFSVTRTTGVGESMSTMALVEGTDYTLSGATITLTDYTTGAEYAVNYTNQVGVSRVRIRTFLGAPGQAAASELVAESAGGWTSSHVGTGLAYLYVRLEYDQDVFGQTGLPEITAVIRGKKVHDPRTGVTAWSDNSALCVADYLRDAALGLGCTAAEVPDDEVIAAANACDEPVALNAGGATQKRYTTNGVLSTETAMFENLQVLLEPMAGTCVWVQGRWLLRAGVWRAVEPVTLNEDWLADGPITILPRPSRTELFNAVSGTFIDPGQRYAEVQFPPVENITYRTQDGGRRVARELPMPMVSDGIRAQRIAKISLERARQALTVRLHCNLRAYNLAPTDVVPVSLARYGWIEKPFEVMAREWEPGGGVMLTLRETAAGVYAWNFGEATAVDLAPNTALPDPRTPPPALTGVTVTSGTAQLQRLADGTVITRGLVAWDSAADVFVLQGGRIECQWKLDNATEWQQAPSVPGDSVSLYIGPLSDQRLTLVRVRPINSAGRAGEWAHVEHTVVGKTSPPSNVAGFVHELKPGQVVVRWDPCEDADYAATELRVGAAWASADFLWRGAGAEYQQARPANGTYTVWAAHRDTSDNYSATPVSLSVTVDDSIDPGAGESVYVEFSVDGSTAWHPTFATGDLFARWRVGLAGAWQGPFRIVGESGAAGDYVDFIFRRSATQPATPTGTSPAGWFDAPPAANGNALWASTATRTAAGALVGAWSTPVQIEGAAGDRSAIVYIYQRSVSAPALPTNTTTYTFSTALPAGMNNGWSATIPSGSNPLWVAAATASAPPATASDTIAPGEWAGPNQLAQDGAQGQQAASIFIYQRTATNSAPTLPSASATYTFATGAVTGLNNGWASTVPASGGGFLWIAQATALGTGATDTIASGEWSSARLLSQDGAQGSAGNTGQSNHRVYRAASIGSPPSTPGSTTSGATPAGWSATPVTLSAGQEQYQSDGVTPAGSTTTTWSTPYPSYLKVGSLDAISANLGTITAGSINTSGFIRADGQASYTVPDPATGTGTSYGTAVAGNISSSASIGVYGLSTSVAGVYGQTSSGSVGSGVFGTGRNGVRGRPNSSGGIGVLGESVGSGSAGIRGLSDGLGAQGGYFTATSGGDGASNVALRAEASGNRTALDVIGRAAFTNPIIVTQATGTPPFTITSTTVVANLNADLLDGEQASSLAQSIGANRVSIGNTTAGSRVATFDPNNKPGANNSTNVWLEVRHGGNTFWVPAWPN